MYQKSSRETYLFKVENLLNSPLLRPGTQHFTVRTSYNHPPPYGNPLVNVLI